MIKNSDVTIDFSVLMIML